MNLDNIREVVLIAINNIIEEQNYELADEVSDSTDILNIFDSMDIVNLIMEIESIIENKLGRYVALADEYTFDNEKSPLSSVKEWVAFIGLRVND